MAGVAHADSSTGILGDWARASSGCARPELSFEPRSATIHVDADGTPAVFHYPAARYQIANGGVIVELGKRHPLAKTPDKFKLQFALPSENRVSLQLRNGRSVAYIRCPVKSSQEQGAKHGSSD